jgi:hypothetical protein
MHVLFHAAAGVVAKAGMDVIINHAADAGELRIGRCQEYIPPPDNTPSIYGPGGSTNIN